MKTTVAIILSAAMLLLSGCVSMGRRMGQDYAAFISAIPAATGSKVSSELKTPFSDMEEHATAFNTDPDKGVFHVVDGGLTWGFPLVGVSKTFTVSDLALAATPEQIAQAKQIAATRHGQPATTK